MILIKERRKKRVLLGIIFLITMGISGIYASTAQIQSGQLKLGGIDIKIQTYKLNSSNQEVVYNEKEKKVEIGSTVSYIPKIKNLGADCFVRSKITYINKNIDASMYITGISSDWEKHGDYYYYKKVLKAGEEIKLLDTVTIPENIRDITSSNKIKIEILAEAIQERNFTPDYTKQDPWKGVEPKESSNTSIDIDTDDTLKMDVEFEDGIEQDITITDSLFGNMKTVMPGDLYTSKIIINNTDKESAKYYILPKIEERYTKEIELLDNIDFVITNKEGDIIYSGKLKNNQKILLGEYNPDEYEELELKISVPGELGSEYSYLNPKITWVFSTDYKQKPEEEIEPEDDKDKEKPETPKTGDNINVAMTVFVFSAIGLIIVMILDRKEKKNTDSIK